MPTFTVGGLNTQPGQAPDAKKFFYQPQFFGLGPKVYRLLNFLGNAEVGSNKPGAVDKRVITQVVGEGGLPTKVLLDFLFGRTNQANPTSAELGPNRKPSGERRFTPDVEELLEKRREELKSKVTEAWRSDP